MSQQKPQLLATTTPEKPYRHQPLVQIEGKLTEEQLKAIAAGRRGNSGDSSNHNETMFVFPQLNFEGGNDV